MHHPLIDCPLYCVDEESPDTAHTEASKEYTQAFVSIGLLRYLYCTHSLRSGRRQ